MDKEDREKKYKLLLGLLKYPGETPNADYKESVEFKESDEFSIKLVRHVLGLANIGGGFIILGFKETDNKPIPDETLDQQITASYETTRFSQHIDSHIYGGSDKIHLEVHKLPLDGKDYPIIEVFGFTKRPFFCNSSKNDKSGKVILKHGALYVRKKANKTEELSTPNDWEELIELCVRNRQDELLIRFRTLMEEVGISSKRTLEIMTGDGQSKILPKPTENKNVIEQWFNKCRVEAEAGLNQNSFPQSYFEITHYIVGDNGKKWAPKDLLVSAEKAVLRHTGWPIGVVLHNDDMKPSPVPDGIKAVIVSRRSIIDSFDYWYLKEDGSYFFLRNFVEDTGENKDKKLFYFDTKIWRMAEAIDHCISLYKALDVNPETKVRLRLRYKGIAGRLLSAWNPHRAMTIWSRRSNPDIGDMEWSADASLDELLLNRNEYILQIAQKVFTMFDFFDPDPGIVKGVIEEYEKSSI